jgi:hypothetical protein
MRRLCFSLLCSLLVVPLVVPAAAAATRATGDGVLELKDAAGTIVVTGTRGTVWGQMDGGKLVVTDPLAGDGAVFVSGAEIVKQIGDTVTSYWGKDLRFRVTGGRYKLTFKGAVAGLPATGIDLTAVGVGTAQLTGDVFVNSGAYALDNGKWTPLTVLTRTVHFGSPPIPPGP